MNKRGFGTFGEQKVKEYLEDEGYFWLCSNFRTSWGEIDLIFRDGQDLVFVEVKTSRTGVPKEYLYYRVGKDKIIKLQKLGQAFIQKHQKQVGNLNPRFDVIFVQMENNLDLKLQHLKGAF